MQAQLSRPDAEQIVAVVRERILTLFPGAEETYELLYAHRFKRFIDEFARPAPASRGVVIPFPADRA